MTREQVFRIEIMIDRPEAFGTIRIYLRQIMAARRTFYYKCFRAPAVDSDILTDMDDLCWYCIIYVRPADSSETQLFLQHPDGYPYGIPLQLHSLASPPHRFQPSATGNYRLNYCALLNSQGEPIRVYDGYY